MSRFALAIALSLIAVVAAAQTDPRTNERGTPPSPTLPRSGGPGEPIRAVQRVQVGEHAPDFELTAADGASFRLRESRGRWTALFFTERRDDLAGVATLARTLDSLNVRALVVCPEKVQSLGAWMRENPASFTALADERGDITALYGLWDNARSSARQGLLLLDPQGIVRVALLGQRVSAPSLPGLVQSAVEGL